MTDNYPMDDLAWLRSTLGGDGAGPPSDVLVRPNLAAAELILPLDSPVVSSHALHRYHDGRSFGERLMTASAQLIARAGLLHRAPGERTTLASFALIDELCVALDEPEIVAAITLGPRRRNRKPVLQLLRPDGTNLGFAKVGWSPFTRELVANEGASLRLVEGKVPTGFIAPRVLLDDENEHRHVVITSPLHTPITARRTDALGADLVISLARSAGSVHKPIRNLPQLGEWQGATSAGLIDFNRLLHRHGDTEVEAGFWHGDLTRWNTATTRRGTMLWDWEFAGTDRPVGFDLLHQEFERVRRHPTSDEHDALLEVVKLGPQILGQIGQPVDAVIDLYLSELIMRECRLKGEGWDPTNLGPLDTVAADLLRRRLEGAA